jgi:hypothetical protein
MKQKQLIIRFFFALALLTSIVVQSLHGYEHLKKQFSEKVCEHKHANSTELTHQHKGFEQCLVCAISFQSGIISAKFQYQIATTPEVATHFFFNFPTVISFSGSSYSLRGPPQYNV